MFLLTTSPYWCPVGIEPTTLVLNAPMLYQLSHSTCCIPAIIMSRSPLSSLLCHTYYIYIWKYYIEVLTQDNPEWGLNGLTDFEYSQVVMSCVFWLTFFLSSFSLFWKKNNNMDDKCCIKMGSTGNDLEIIWWQFTHLYKCCHMSERYSFTSLIRLQYNAVKEP